VWQSGAVDTGELLGELLGEVRERLEAAGVEPPDVDAELIAAHVLGESRGRVQALTMTGGRIDADRAERIRGLAGERARRIPLQHLTGRAAFRGIELDVGPGVFVPRPETEVVAQFAIDALLAVPKQTPFAVDLCTGSAAIALALAQEVPTARVWAVEKSPEAHAWAQRNVAALGDGRVELVLGDAADALALLPEEVVGRVDVLISNPPYVPAEMVPRDPEVRDHDPELALYGGADGLDLVRVISRVGLRIVAPGGLLVVEHAETQGAAIRALLEADGWRAPATHQDLTLRDRATLALSES